ncbi:hypothetical protein K1T71_009840 [Dendrolimus kikuchii]|uniref:Uncharacterized protein n=1 Tax=Dendrolimus kikuchii TaxID=765133 RepID=A0ACC1CU24_9NEOP|nr:hypothetical protein K1T71_009840 [Dendrolimus kikuchii]
MKNVFLFILAFVAFYVESASHKRKHNSHVPEEDIPNVEDYIEEMPISDEYKDFAVAGGFNLDAGFRSTKQRQESTRRHRSINSY